jgi:diaminopimelate decarboxylase
MPDRHTYSLAQSDLTCIEGLVPQLRYESGVLRIAGVPAPDMLRRDSPALIYLGERALDNYAELRDAFGARWPDSRVHFAMKCCYVRPLLEALVAAGAGLEVMSEIELLLAVACGADPAGIIATGVGRTPRYLAAAQEAGVGLIVADSLADLRRIAEASRPRRARQRVAVRVTIGAEPAELRYVGHGSKLGIDSPELADALRAARAASEIEVVGLHCHVLSRCRDPRSYGRMAAQVVQLAQMARRDLGVTFEVIDLGGGLDARFAIERGGYRAADFAAAAAEQLEQLDYRPMLLIEPGRFIAADAAVTLTNVVEAKSNSGARFYIVDVSSNILIPRPGMDYPALPLALPRSERDWDSVAVADRTCTANLLAPHAALPRDLVGEGLCLLNCGAYTSVFAELWAFELPVIQYLDGAGLREVLSRGVQASLWQRLHGIDLGIR